MTLSEFKLPNINNNIQPFIGGQSVTSESDNWIETINPADNSVLTRIPGGTISDVDKAVANSRKVFNEGIWRDQTPSQKKKVLHRFADLIIQHANELDQLDALEMGKPITLGAFNAARAASHVHFMAEAVDKLESSVLLTDEKTLVLNKLMPRGVIAAIIPWNFPTFNVVLKISAALAAGNSVVLKPPEIASQSAFKLAKLALEANLPPGILNVVPGLGHTVGKALALHMDVDMVTFTGSTAIGKLVMQYAGQSNMKKVVAECGGKSPQIVFDDGLDLDLVATGIAENVLINQGQLCSMGSRLLVPSHIQEQVVNKICERLSDIKVGNPLAPDTTYGPLAGKSHFSRVSKYIDDATRQGADLAYGGERLLESTGGNYLNPAVFLNVNPASAIAQEEIFGPVLSVMPFETQQEAIELANSTCYGLTSYIWTAQTTTAMAMAQQIPTSVTVLNTTTLAGGEGPGDAISVEPYAQSGVGVEGGLAGLKGFMRQQVIWLNHS